MKKSLRQCWMVFVLMMIVILGSISSAKSDVTSSPNLNLSNKKAPVRIPRSFFKGPLSGTLQVHASVPSFQLEKNTHVAWVEEPTELPSPQPGAIADYRDFTGCAQYSEIDSVAVCFNVMPDVSSVGVNQKDVSLRNIESYVASELNSNQNDNQYEVRNVQLMESERTQSQVKMDFTGEAVSINHPEDPVQPITIQFRLQNSTANF